ncbi:EpsG family protein [Fusobacterium necrophorum]|uniref:EpsG family protein n=1 Tax=Fusobacterium necrophorum TaxID=859 RepID=UPI000881CA8E|nr:EpsG family protein [Fusobacterium necrophorum]AYZ73038.1 EpsG family protein [Fusobacterium necrophorum]AZW08962.1 EpsG family protein [Fusobacterium necrophorum subsp. necrophorum]SDB39728.1 EpsG family protein [Fusobacterium necrophorum]SQD09948.1 Uncharacterised protein [Fusobacterium necrophorum subsp. necrophorum]
MIYYICLYVLFTLNFFNKYKKYIRKFSNIIFCIFLCFTYMNGSDWKNYEILYTQYSFQNFLSFPFEKLFCLYFSLFKIFRVDFWVFFILTKVVCFCVFMKIIYKFSINYFLVQAIFFVQLGLYLFIDCPLRNLIAISLGLLSIDYFIERKNFISFLYFILAVMFHNSALILLLFFFFYTMMWERNRSKMVLMMLLILSVIFTDKRILFFFLNVLKSLPAIYFRVYNYFGTKYDVTEIFNIRLVEKYIVAVLSLVYYKKISKKYKYGEILVLLNMIFLVFYRIGSTFTALIRLALYFRIFNIILLSYIINLIKDRYLKYFCLVIYLIYMSFNLYFLIRDTRLYYPYTSYLQYIGKEKPSYEDRINFLK